MLHANSGMDETDLDVRLVARADEHRTSRPRM
jgi:hypothetical protein